MTPFDTSKGQVPVWGRLRDFSSERPALFVVRGAFPIQNHWVSLADRLPQADVALVHLPGMHTPFFADGSIQAFATAFDEVMAQVFPDRPVNVVGFSIGGVVALSMRNRAIRTVIAIDPPLSTAGLWPMRDWLRTKLSESDDVRDWIWRIFGVSETEVIERDYSWALTGLAVPTRVLLGADPLEPERPSEGMPSLVSEADRRLFTAHPRIQSLTVTGTGHNIPADALGVVMDSMRLVLGIQGQGA